MPDNKRYTPQASTGGRSGAKENRQEIEDFCGKIIFHLHISKKKCTFALAFSEFKLIK